MKKPLLILIIVVILVLLGIMIYPFFNTGVIIKNTSNDITVMVDKTISDPSKLIKLHGGKHEIEVKKKGFKVVKDTFNVHFYGATTYKLSLSPSEPIKDLPYYFDDMNDMFIIESETTQGGGTKYIASYFSEKAKINAESWLKSNGITSDDYNIEYIFDGD
jgi:hypothetical protein